VPDANDGQVVTARPEERDDRRAGKMLGDERREPFVMHDDMRACAADAADAADSSASSIM